MCEVWNFKVWFIWVFRNAGKTLAALVTARLYFSNKVWVGVAAQLQWWGLFVRLLWSPALVPFSPAVWTHAVKRIVGSEFPTVCPRVSPLMDRRPVLGPPELAPLLPRTGFKLYGDTALHRQWWKGLSLISDCATFKSPCPTFLSSSLLPDGT